MSADSGYRSADGLDVRADGGVLHISMNNPRRRNALGDDAVEAFIEALIRANSDDDVRAVLVKGEGNEFCTGADIVARNAPSDRKPRVGAISRRLPRQAHRLIPTLLKIEVPVVAAARGYAAGLGLQILLACDFAVVARDATLWEPFSARGMGPDGGATWLLPRCVGPVRAREMLLLGRRISGEEAVEWGIGLEAVDAGEVDMRAQTLAVRLSEGPTVSLGLTRALINSSATRTLDDHLAFEGYGMEIASRSLDFREGLSAFVEKRDPQFGGR